MNPLIETLLYSWPWRPISSLLLICLAAIYVYGWRRTRRAFPGVASVWRLVAFSSGLAMVSLAMISPLYIMGHQLLAARSAQQIMLMLAAPPLLWLGCPFHVIAWGLPPAWRRGVTRRILTQDSSTGRIGRLVTRPGPVWLSTVSVFLIWHDPGFVAWTLRYEVVYSLALWTVLITYLLFWWHLIDTAPRIHRALPAWVTGIYLLVGGELPNMVAGVTLAYRETPAYAPYTAGIHYGIAPLYDQMASGGMIWVSGSVVYVIALVLIVGRYFNAGDGPPQLSGQWEATERTIAPGLEERVLPDHLRRPGDYH